MQQEIMKKKKLVMAHHLGVRLGASLVTFFSDSNGAPSSGAPLVTFFSDSNVAPASGAPLVTNLIKKLIIRCNKK